MDSWSICIIFFFSWFHLPYLYISGVSPCLDAEILLLELKLRLKGVHPESICCCFETISTFCGCQSWKKISGAMECSHAIALLKCEFLDKTHNFNISSYWLKIPNYHFKYKKGEKYTHWLFVVSFILTIFFFFFWMLSFILTSLVSLASSQSLDRNGYHAIESLCIKYLYHHHNH